VAWSKDHPGAACPDVAALGITEQDPWGHPLQLTCSDQPANQIIGAISAGPDGTPGNGDDIASWQLGHDVTDLVRGTRWVVAVAKPTPAKQTVAVKHDTPAKKPPAETKPAAGSAAPQKPKGVLLDENGIPIQR
jgi:hypothetical protein